jgi:hypothetical protein
MENEGRNQTKTQVSEDSNLCPETSTKNVVQEMFSPLLPFVADLEDTREVGHQNIAGCKGGSRELVKLQYHVLRWNS